MKYPNCDQATSQLRFLNNTQLETRFPQVTSEQVMSSSKILNTYTKDEHPDSNSRSQHSNCFRTISQTPKPPGSALKSPFVINLTSVDTIVITSVVFDSLFNPYNCILHNGDASLRDYFCCHLHAEPVKRKDCQHWYLSLTYFLQPYCHISIIYHKHYASFLTTVRKLSCLSLSHMTCR